MWSEEDLFEIVKDYLRDPHADIRHLMEYLTPDMVPEKYRVPPKSRKLYNGTRIRNVQYAASQSNDTIALKPKLLVSMSSSISTAREFAQGLMGNDYSPRDKRDLGIVVAYDVGPEDVIFTVGKFLRSTGARLDCHRSFRAFGCENEYIVRNTNGVYTTPKKSQIVWTTHRLFST